MRIRRFKAVEGEVGIYHCISRITHGEMRLDKREKEVLRKQMWQVADFCGVEILTYALMTNHFHLLVRVPVAGELSDEELARRLEVLYGNDLRAQTWAKWLREGGAAGGAIRAKLLNRMQNVSAFLKELKQRFSIWYNRVHGTFGTLWSSRFKSLLVEEESAAVAIVAAYIDLNPVRAGLCQDPKDYRWCGYAEAVGGRAEAQRGLMAVWKGRGISAGQPENWGSVRRAYRAMLAEKRGPREYSLQIFRGGGNLSLGEAMGCRVRYFSDGALLGSREFVQRWFEVQREGLSPSRRVGPRALRGCAAWAGLAVYRALRVRPFG
jgi:putative transposase